MESHADDTIIRLRDVSIQFEGRSLFEDVNLDVRRGEFLAVSGPNGGGKTTLLRIILKLLKPTRGSVTYYEQHKPAKWLPIGYLPQKSMIDVRFPITAGEVIRSGLITGWRFRMTDADRERFSQIVELTGTQDYLNRPVGDLSGGQLQRTLLGRALISQPEVVILDEPLSYVDKQFEHQIYSIMERVAQKATVILVSHEMTYISRMATRHILVDHGIHECTAHCHYTPSHCE